MLLAAIVEASAALAATRSRKAKVAVLAELLRAAEPGERPAAVAFLTGQLLQSRIGAGWRTLTALDADPVAASELTVSEVDAALTELAATSGAGSAQRRTDQLTGLFRRATEAEQRFLLHLITGELRHGALEGVMVDGIATAAGVPIDAVRRAFMLSGRLPATAEAAMTGGEAALWGFRLELGRPIRPMLASPAESLTEALAQLGSDVVVEYKMDGARIQVHRVGDEVRVWTRTLREITAHVGELVSLVRALPCESVVLDGETLGLTDDGRPRPFQQTLSRFGSTHDAGSSTRSSEGGAKPRPSGRRGEIGRKADPAASSWPAASHAEQVRALLLHPYFFDCLHLDGVDLLDAPLRERLSALHRVAGEHVILGEVSPADPEGLLRKALADGHEGVMAKALDSPYAAGRRGKSWLKIKPVHTIDLVVLAAEWGHGRRVGYLSNLHLGARDPEGGEPIMVGKTFKGLTDELLAWQTEALQRIESSRTDWAVYTRPELVVEIELDGVQTSTRYPGGVALRFARVVRYRPDKDPGEADTIDAVRELLP